MSSRSFGQPVTRLQDLTEAVSTYAARAAEKLRQEGQAAGAIQVFLSTNAFIPGEPQYHPALLVRLSSPTQDTSRLTRAACQGVRRIFKRGYRYKKAGVMLLDFVPAGVAQGDLFAPENPAPTERRIRLMETVDSINHEMGKGTLRLAAEGVEKIWKMRRDSLTPSYTTEWDALPLATA